MNGHLRSLSWAIGREDSQTGDIHPIEMMIRIAEKLSGPFGRSVRGDGLDIKILFREGNPLIFSIDRGRGRKDEVFDSMGFAGFQKDDGSTNVHILVKKGIGDGRPHPSPGSQVDNEINPMFSERLLKMLRVSNIPCDEFKQFWELLFHSLHISDLYIGIIKAVKVVEANHLDSLTQEAFAKMGTDEAGSPRNENGTHRSPILSPADT